ERFVRRSIASLHRISFVQPVTEEILQRHTKISPELRARLAVEGTETPALQQVGDESAGQILRILVVTTFQTEVVEDGLPVMDAEFAQGLLGALRVGLFGFQDHGPKSGGKLHRASGAGTGCFIGTFHGPLPDEGDAGGTI